LIEISKQYPRDKVRILSMNAINPAKQAAADAKLYKIPFDVLLCRETGVIRDYEISKLPYIFIIDGQGIIRESKLFLKSADIKTALDKLLAEAQPPAPGK